MKIRFAEREQLKQFAIGVSERATRSEQEAAAELQSYWKAVFGIEPGIVHQPVLGPMAWVGFEGAPKEAIEGLDPDAFAPDEILVRTFEKDGHPQLLLAGGPEEGTRYAVYQFIEDYLGVRWLTAWDTHIPEAPASIPAIEYRYAPPFYYRYTHYFTAARVYADERPDALAKVEAFMWHMRCRQSPPGAHTFYRYVPPEKYAAGHPEYYSLVNGKRIAPQKHSYSPVSWGADTNMHTDFGQLCMTNPEVIEIIKRQIDADIAENPEKEVHHISQMDWYNWCECEHCAALDKQEGTHMGSVLWALNQIADWLAEKHPDHKLETLAYQYTRTAPKHMKPRPNIIIKLCSIECDWATPLFSERNRAYAEDLRAWTAIATEVISWDYYSNYSNFAIPMPNFHVIAPNLRFLAAQGVMGLYQHSGYDEAAEFAALRGYLLGRLMWNPDLDPEALMDEFLTLYYGASGKHVRRYIKMLTEVQQATGKGLGCFDPGAWYTADAVAKARSIMADAYAVAPNDEVRFRLDRVNATVEFNALKCAPQVTLADGIMTVTRPDSLTLDEYTALLERIGTKYVTDYFGKLDHVRLQVGGATPPRHQESPLLTLENERYLLWVAPDLQGTVVRFYDKQLDAELLADPQVYGQRGGFWQDWTDTPGKHEHVIAQRYDVVAHTREKLVMEAVTEAGLRVRRTMVLEPGADTIAVSLTLTNTTDEPLRANAKIHPEFFLPAGQPVALYGLKDGAWEPLNEGDERRPRTLYFGPEYEKLAYFLPEEDRTVDVQVDGAIGGFLSYYTGNAQHMNLDLRPPQRDLAPGESVTFGGRYGATAGRPDAG